LWVGNQESESKVNKYCRFIISRDFDVLYVMLFVMMTRSIAFQVTRDWTQSADVDCGSIDPLTRHRISLPEAHLTISRLLTPSLPVHGHDPIVFASGYGSQNLALWLVPVQHLSISLIFSPWVVY
jgi:hypothetical protein